MAQDRFTKEEAAEMRGAVDEMFSALSKPKQREFLGHLNDVLLFLSAAGKAAPNKGK